MKNLLFKILKLLNLYFIYLLLAKTQIVTNYDICPVIVTIVWLPDDEEADGTVMVSDELLEGIVKVLEGKSRV